MLTIACSPSVQWLFASRQELKPVRLTTIPGTGCLNCLLRLSDGVCVPPLAFIRIISSGSKLHSFLICSPSEAPQAFRAEMQNRRTTDNFFISHPLRTIVNHRRLQQRLSGPARAIADPL